MEDRITGTMIYYHSVCKKKLWYFMNDITMESGSDLVQLGKLLDSESYSKEDRNININNEISIDFIQENNEIHEIKKSRKIEEASILQLKYYMYYLKKRGVNITKGVIDYPLMKKKIDVFLEKDDISNIENIIKEIIDIKHISDVYKTKNKSICKSCAYYDICYI